MISRALLTSACLLLGCSVAIAQDKTASKEEGAVKEVSGMSIVGNNESPKALIIVPWKSSEIGQETNFNSSLLSQEIVPVDKPTFLRELDFYKLANPN